MSHVPVTVLPGKAGKLMRFFFRPSAPDDPDDLDELPDEAWTEMPTDTGLLWLEGQSEPVPVRWLGPGEQAAPGEAVLQVRDDGTCTITPPEAS